MLNNYNYEHYNRDISIYVDVNELVANCDISIYMRREHGNDIIDSYGYEIIDIVGDDDNYYQLNDFTKFEQEQIIKQIEKYIEDEL